MSRVSRLVGPRRMELGTWFSLLTESRPAAIGVKGERCTFMKVRAAAFGVAP
jgi:hypothetical protein